MDDFSIIVNTPGLAVGQTSRTSQPMAANGNKVYIITEKINPTLYAALKRHVIMLTAKVSIKIAFFTGKTKSCSILAAEPILAQLYEKMGKHKFMLDGMVIQPTDTIISLDMEPHDLLDAVSY